MKDKRSTTSRGTASGGNSRRRLVDGEIAAAHQHRRRSTRSKTSRVNNDSQDERAEDADRGALRVDSKRSQGARRKGNDGNDDVRLGDGPNLDLENKFHRQRPR